MNEFEEQMHRLKLEYPEKKPVCFNYFSARTLIFSLLRENHALRKQLSENISQEKN